MNFLFPADPMNPKKIDAYFKPQAEVLAPNGYALVSLDDLKVTHPMDDMVYRGWMLSDCDYFFLTGAVVARGFSMLVSSEEYVATHHLPNWYKHVQGHTAETLVYPNMSITFDLDEKLAALGWDSLLRNIAQRIPSPFYSVDIAYNEAGGARVVEMGDGQVSDLVGEWDVNHFAECLKEGFSVVHDEVSR